MSSRRVRIRFGENTAAIVDDCTDTETAPIWSRFNGKRADTLWYYRALAGAFHAAEPTPLTTALNRAVADLERETTVQPGDTWQRSGDMFATTL